MQTSPSNSILFPFSVLFKLYQARRNNNFIKWC